MQNPYDRPEPQGFGPISPWWIQRQRFVGTCDNEWKDSRHPNLPVDFDYRFYQAAHPNLIMPRFLTGTELVQVEGCRPGGDTLSFHLPNIALIADHAWDDGRAVSSRLNLDGVHIDFRGDKATVDFTWRGWIARCPAYLFAELDAVRLNEASGYPSCDEHGLAEGLQSLESMNA